MERTYQKIREYIGDENQLMPFQLGKLAGGFQDGVSFAEIGNGGNLSVTVLPDRCMDIYQVRYKGKNINYLATCGIIAPEYYDAQGYRWLRSFFVGMLTTLGLQHLGKPSVRPDGEELGLHGRIDNTPAEQVRYTRGIEGNQPTLLLEGCMREARLFGENLTLHRSLKFKYEEDCIWLKDTVTNHGFGSQPFVYGLHLNYGYPLLDEGVKLIMDSQKVIPREENAARHIDTWQQVEAPQHPYPERCYFHELKKDKNGISQYTLFNEKRKIGVNVRYEKEYLPFFCQWKMMGKGEYVMGLEPMNVFMDGPKIGEPGCMAPVLEPGESIDYTVKISFIDQI